MARMIGNTIAADVIPVLVTGIQWAASSRAS
jgi:hypothetical protein